MPSIAELHPQVVHFAIALLFVGVPLRFVSLGGKIPFAKHAATLLLLLGTAAAAVSVKSGADAHGPVERIPGVRNAVVEHEEHGEQARNVFLVVAAIELLALGLGARGAAARVVQGAYVASALVGAYGMGVLYEAAEHGGELVYSYAGGPGIRSGDTTDVRRLLMAGLYSQAQADRKAGRPLDAVRLTQEMAYRFAGDTTVRFLVVESLQKDNQDLAGALAAARAIPIDTASPRWAARLATVLADLHVAMGHPDSARTVLAPAVARFPQNARLKAKLDSLK